MKILNRYVTIDFTATLLVAIGVVAFGLLGAQLIKVFGVVAKGVPFSNAMLSLLFFMPYMLSMAIPCGVLVAIMLVFGRMSADNEITAMRACGISILQIISPILIWTFLMSCLCLYLQLFAAPQYYGKSRALMTSTILENPLAIFEPGTQFEYNDLIIYIDESPGEGKIEDVQIFQMNKQKDGLKADITAARGEIEVDKKNRKLFIKLYDVIGTQFGKDGKKTTTSSREAVFPIDYGKQLNSRDLAKRDKYLVLNEIFGRMKMFAKRGLDTTRFTVELNKRIALGLSPIAFLLLGLPMAIRTSRKETSIGLFLSVSFALIYFISVKTLSMLVNHPEIYPQYLLWAPSFLYQIAGLFMLYRITKR